MEKNAARYDSRNFKDLMAAHPYVTDDGKFLLLVHEVHANGTVKYEAYLPESGERTDLWGTLNLWEFFRSNLRIARIDDLANVPANSFFAKDFKQLPKMLDSDG